MSAIEHVAKKQVRSRIRHEMIEGGEKLKMLSENGKLSSMHYYSLFLIREYVNNNCELDVKREAIYWHNKAKSKDLNKRFEDTRNDFLDKVDNFCFNEKSK
ncbi:hypothetical protein [Vibrio nigripulchritudo]|nr:hypothetical protein [Vibrio nigripulchritudo]